jgi:two-component system, OmpR family, response regulator
MEDKKPKILLCEDDNNLGKVLKNYLELNDFDVSLERDGLLGLAAFQREKFDLCLLDVMMPKMDGFTAAEEIRDINPDVPLFFLTAKSMKEDVVKGYQLGANDYITKPFDSQLLLQKIKAIIQQTEELHREENNAEFEIGTYHYIPRLRQLIQDGKTIGLSPKENLLLKMLNENRNKLLVREVALKKIWGSISYFNGRSMDVYIAKLRKILGEDASIELANVHGHGFKLIVPE